MIEQVLEEIKQAENKASEIKSQADDLVTEIGKKAEEKVSSVLADAEDTVKREKALGKVRTAKSVEKLYDEIIATAKADVETLYNSKTADINELADEMVGKVINGDC